MEEYFEGNYKKTGVDLVSKKGKMQKNFFVLLIAALFVCGSVTALAYESHFGDTGVVYYDSDQAYEGYTLFATRGESYLIDMEGNLIHTWPIGTNPRFLDNGNLLDASKDDPSGYGGFIEMDWEGNTVWEYTESRDGYYPKSRGTGFALLWKSTEVRTRG